jgi:hypothetical protein
LQASAIFEYKVAGANGATMDHPATFVRANGNPVGLNYSCLSVETLVGPSSHPLLASQAEADGQTPGPVVSTVVWRNALSFSDSALPPLETKQPRRLTCLPCQLGCSSLTPSRPAPVSLQARLWAEVEPGRAASDVCAFQRVRHSTRDRSYTEPGVQIE